MASSSSETDFLALTARIVAAHVSSNPVSSTELPALIESIHKVLVGLETVPAEEPERTPAVPVKKSVFPDYLICLEDGKKLKMLKRHLATSYAMTPDQYRQRWGLPASYPMVAPNYAAQRSTLARQIGLGRKPGTAAAEPEPAPAAVEAPVRRGPGRPKRVAAPAAD